MRFGGTRRTSRVTEAQIVAIRQEAESGLPVADLLRKHGLSRPTFSSWRSRYGGATVAELTKLKALEADHAKLKRLYAELAMEYAAYRFGRSPTQLGNIWRSSAAATSYRTVTRRLELTRFRDVRTNSDGAIFLTSMRATIRTGGAFADADRLRLTIRLRNDPGTFTA